MERYDLHLIFATIEKKEEARFKLKELAGKLQTTMSNALLYSLNQTLNDGQEVTGKW